METYEYVAFLGQGSYGEVQLVNHLIEEKQYVLKKIGLSKASEKEIFAAEQEASLLSQLKHINIVSYRQSFQHNGALCIVMQYCEGGDLHSWLAARKGKLLEESQVIVWFVQISLALQYLHGKNILHRDLKTQNIFLTHKNEIVKVGDLGIARVLENTHDMASTVIGTPYYMSPELFSNKPYNYKSDVWSLGCVVYEMCTMKHAFKARDFSGLALKICRGQVPPLPSEFSTELSALVGIMLAQKAEDRPSVSEILQQRFIRTYIQIFIKRNRQQSKSEERKSKRTSNHKPQNYDHQPQAFEPNRSIERTVTTRGRQDVIHQNIDIVRKGSIEKSEENNHSPHIRQQRQNNRNRMSESDAMAKDTSKISSKRLSNSHHLALIPSVIDLLKKDDTPAYIKYEDHGFVRGEPRRSSAKENDRLVQENNDQKTRQISSARKRRIEDKRNSFRSIDRSSPSSDLFSSQSSSSGSPSPTHDFYPVNVPARCSRDEKSSSVPNSPTTYRKNSSPTPPRTNSSPTPPPLRTNSSPTPPQPRRNSSPTPIPPRRNSSPIPLPPPRKNHSPTPTPPRKNHSPTPTLPPRKNHSPTPPPPRKNHSPTPPPPRRNISPIPGKKPNSPTTQKKLNGPVTHKKASSPNSQRKAAAGSTPRPFRIARPLPPTPRDDRHYSKQHSEEDYTKLVDLMNDTLVTQDEPSRPSSSPGQNESLSRLKDRLESLRNQVLPRVSREILEKAYRVLDDSDPDKVQIKLMLLLGQGTNPELMNQVMDMYVCEHRLSADYTPKPRLSTL